MVLGSGSKIDSEAIRQSVETCYDRLGDMVAEVHFQNYRDGPYMATPISVREARLTFTHGINSQVSYLDIQWWINGDYKYHYQEDGLAFRFGRERDNKGTSKPVVHFHPPDDLTDHKKSCIQDGHPPKVVTLAVIANWFPAVKQSDPSVLNTQSNPP